MQLHIPQQALKDMAGHYGTPLYVYNGHVIEEQYNLLKKAFEKLDVKIFYACKALTNVNILKHIISLGCNIDCSSINEAKLALYAGATPDKVLYTSSGIAFSEIEEAVSLGISINIDSLSNLEKFAQKYGGSYAVGVRVRPNIMAGGNLKISTGHDKSKFGIPIEQVGDILAIEEKCQLNITTLHLHTGSDIKEFEVFIESFNVLSGIIPRFKNLKAIDLGGGFKVPYKEGEQGLDVVQFGEKLHDFFSQNPAVANLQIWFEPGKFLVSQCGYFITAVNILKHTPTTSFACVDSGFNHLIRPMFYESYHHIINLSGPNGELKTYTVSGNICETDNFAIDRPISQISEGDYLLFFNAGAYGFEMSSNYNSRYKPAEIFWYNNQAKLIRRRDVFEDLLSTQVLD